MSFRLIWKKATLSDTKAKPGPALIKWYKKPDERKV